MSSASPKKITDWIAVALLGIALGLGGATGQGFWSDSIAQLAGVFVVFAVILSALNASSPSSLRTPLVLAAMVVVVPSAQLIPLPPEVWSVLPGRSTIYESFVQIGVDPPWLPLSLSPEKTLRACLSLVPPVAVFLSAALLGPGARRWMALSVLAFVGLSIALGAAQISDGPSSPLRFYPATNLGAAVGFFANRNHFSALLYSGVCFLGAWTIWLAQRRGEKFQVALVLCLMLYVMLAAAILMAGSRAGIGLAMLAAIGIGSMAVRELGGGVLAAFDMRDMRFSIILATIAGVVVITGAFLSATKLVDLIETMVVREARLEIFKTTWSAANAYAPIGAGFGTFASVYQMFESPQQIASEFINRAHNDWLEIWLEGGLVSVGAAAAFFVWFARASARAWRKSLLAASSHFDSSLARASTIVVLVLVLHSFVDYPLRTTAIASIFGFACGSLVGAGRREEMDRHPRDIRHDTALDMPGRKVEKASEGESSVCVAGRSPR